MTSPRTLAFAAELPAWMEALRDRAGPMLVAATDLAKWKGPSPFPDGHAGIRRLGKLVDEAAFDETFTELDDARFVEGAGAMLGMLLLSHVGLGRHRERDGRHRIEIGEHGFFDPFAAIDSALDAARPSEELAHRVSMAEAEAHGDGPIAKTTSRFVAALARHGKTVRVRDRFEAAIALDDGVEVDLERFVSLAGDDDADLDAALDRFVVMLGAKDAGRSLPWAEASNRILPRLASHEFVASLSSDHAGGGLASRDVTTGLRVALVLEFDGRLRFVRATEVEAWAAEASVDPYEVALARLDARAGSTRWRAETLGGRACATATRADGLAATLLLVPRIRAELGARLGDPFVVAVPHRDRLIAASDARDAAGLQAYAEDERNRAPHGIAGGLYRVFAHPGAAPWIEFIS